MTEDLITVGTVAAVVGCALVAGLLFAFSTSVLPALRQRPSAEGIAVMQTINSTILNPLFGLVFGGTTVLCLVLAVTAPSRPTSRTRPYGASGARSTWWGVCRDHGGERADEQRPRRSRSRQRRGRVVLAHVPAAVDGVEPRAGAGGHRGVGNAGRVAPVTPPAGKEARPMALPTARG